MYTYAFFKPAASPLNLPSGIAAPVQVVGNQHLAAAVEPELSEHDLNQIQQQDDTLVQAILAHDRVLQGLFLQTTLLPLRFGTQFASLQSLLTHLDAHQQTYLETLTQFEGRAEYQLKFTPLQPQENAVSPALKGKAYFLAKKNQHQSQLEYQTQRQQELEAIVIQIQQAHLQYRIRSHQTEGESLYLLVRRDRQAQLLQQFQVWQSQCSCWRLTLGEALPPYHFLEQ